MNELLKVTLEGLLLMVISIIPIISKYLINFVSVKINSTKEKTKNETEKKLLENADKIIEDSVKYVSQTFVDKLKASGEFDVASQKAAFQLALSNIEETLSAEMKEFIMINYGDLTNWVTTKIEATINELKK